MTWQRWMTPHQERLFHLDLTLRRGSHPYRTVSMTAIITMVKEHHLQKETGTSMANNNNNIAHAPVSKPRHPLTTKTQDIYQIRRLHPQEQASRRLQSRSRQDRSSNRSVGSRWRRLCRRLDRLLSSFNSVAVTTVTVAITLTEEEGMKMELAVVVVVVV